jgi:hypothetical protein
MPARLRPATRWRVRMRWRRSPPWVSPPGSKSSGCSFVESRKAYLPERSLTKSGASRTLSLHTLVFSRAQDWCAGSATVALSSTTPIWRVCARCLGSWSWIAVMVTPNSAASRLTMLRRAPVVPQLRSADRHAGRSNLRAAIQLQGRKHRNEVRRGTGCHRAAGHRWHCHRVRNG